eukprot:7883401-Alexandrium_andersonii.AAC.1
MCIRDSAWGSLYRNGCAALGPAGAAVRVVSCFGIAAQALGGLLPRLTRPSALRLRREAAHESQINTKKHDSSKPPRGEA